MKFFVDSANLSDVEAALRRGFVDGVTTNPSLLAKEPKKNFEDHIKNIVSLIREHKDGAHLSVEVFSKDPAEIRKQALHFQEIFQYSAMSVKIQIGWDELELIKKLSTSGININCTACMSVTQALMAARAGAHFVSLFWGRIRDAGDDVRRGQNGKEALERKALDFDDFNPYTVVRTVREIFDRDKISSEIIVGSIRSVQDVRDAGNAGAHIVTVPPKFFNDMVSHFKTDEVIQQFLTDFRHWLQ